MINITVEYYNENADAFSSDTQNLDFSEIQDNFLKFLSEGDRILDFGCGAGRDARYFLAHGMRVDLIDGSWRMCDIAGKNTGIEPKCMLFQEFCGMGEYDGVWACASLLHLFPEELIEVLTNLSASLKDGGLCYISFKYGEFEGIRNSRYFLNMTERRMTKILEEIGMFHVMEMFVSRDVRKKRKDELWLNVFLKKGRKRKDEC